MKLRSILLLSCFALYTASAQVANYWDVDGPTPGAGGATPAGTWDTGSTANWSTDATGSSATTSWTDNDDAVFSAGSDATGTFTVDLSGTPVVGNLTVEEGVITIAGGTALNIGGGVASNGVINISAGSTLAISSVVTGGDDSGSITKDNGTGTLVLSGANTYTGQTTLRVGTLSYDSIGDVNAGASALGNPADATAGTIQLGKGGAEAIFEYTGTGQSSDRVIDLAGGEGDVTLKASGSGPIVFTSPSGISVTGGGIHYLYFDGSNTGVNTITGPIVDGANLTRVAKFGEGTWALLEENSTYSGVTDIRFGRLVVASLAPGGQPSSIGTGSAGSQHLIIGFGGNGGDNGTNATLKYIGSGSSCDRNMRVYGIQGTPGGATIDASGTGALELSGNLLRPGSAQNDTVDKVLTLKGDNTDDNAFNGIISDWNFGGPIGRTLVTKDGPGKWILGGANAYTGETTVKDGTLLVNNWLAAGSAVTVHSGATFGGTGVVNGPVTVLAGGTLSPGASIGTFMLGGDLILSGNLLIEVNTSVAPSSDLVSVVGILTNAGTGTVMVTNLGPALAEGDSFRLFDKAMANGEAMTIVSAENVVWTNKLWVDGTIAVLAVGVSPPAVPATNVTIAAAGPASFSLGGKGAANSAYDVYASTNLAIPMSNWWLIGTTNSDGGGLIQFLDPQATNDQRFYRFGQTVSP